MSKNPRHSIAGTVIYGLFILVPIAVVFLLLVKLTEILEKIAVPLGLESSFGAAIALLIAVMAALLVVGLLSWIAGAIIRRLVSFEKFEGAILNQVPGYQIVANIVKGFSDSGASYPPCFNRAARARGGSLRLCDGGAQGRQSHCLCADNAGFDRGYDLSGGARSNNPAGCWCQ